MPEASRPPTDYSPMWDEVMMLGGRPLYYDREGRPMTLREFSRRFQDRGYKTIRRELVGDWQVVTVWLGEDQRDLLSRGDGPPLIFGVIRWTPEGSYDQLAERFFPSEDEALEYHRELRKQCAQEAAAWTA